MKLAFSRLLVCAVGLAFVAGSASSAAEWGTLKGRVVYDGPVPEPQTIIPDKNPEVCGKHKLVREDLVVAPDGALANVLVVLRTKSPAVNPEYETTAKDEVVLDNHDCRFEPHVVLLRTTQTLVVKNSDQTGHNTNLAVTLNPPQNPIIPAGTSDKFSFPVEESVPPPQVSCNIHTWMKAWLVVRSNPYMAVTDAKGNFTIKDLPAGKELEFQVWQERCGYVRNVKFKGGKTDAKGHFKITLKPGDTDLGELKVPAGLFAK